MAATMSRKSVFLISHITLPDCRVHFSPTTFLETGVYNKGVWRASKPFRSINYA